MSSFSSFHRHLLLAAATLGLTLGSPVTHADPIDDLLSAEISKHHLPAISVAVVHQGKLVKTAAAGQADLENHVPATPQSVFQIQSITKTFTATAILMLVDEGRLRLVDPVSKHLEGTPDAWKDITLRHLLDHTSGIKDFINEPTASLRLDVSEEEVFRATTPRPLNFTPGSRYAYSNSNYHLLAMILRKLTGKFYGDVLHERVFQPLGLNQTRIFSHSALVPGRASGYFWTGSEFRRGDFVAEPILAYGGGGILSTAPDLATWASALLDGRLLEPETLAAAWTPATLSDGRRSSYGLGWGLGEVAGHREISHTGAHMTGFSSSLSLYPEDHLAVVVLLNRRGANPGLIARKIAGLYVPALAPQPPRPIPDSDPDTARILRDLISRVPEWRLDESQFTPDLWRLLDSRRHDLQAQSQALGNLRSLDLLHRDRNQDLRTSRFRAVFDHQSLIITITMNEKHLISGLDSDEEQ